MSISTISFQKGTKKMQNIHPIKMYIKMSRHKIIWKLAYLDVEMMSLLQKHKIIRKVAYLGVRKLLKSSVSQERKLGISICVRQKIAKSKMM